MKCGFVNKHLFKNSQKLFKPKKMETKVASWVCAKNPKTNDVRFIPNFELGEIINSGREADVFCIKGFDDKIARVTKGFVYSPKKLNAGKIDSDTFFSSLDEGIKIQKKINGEPLYGKFWDFLKKPSFGEYIKTLDTMIKLPDETYLKYIHDVLDIRKNGFDIDRVNPNNFLFDKNAKTINIVDKSANKVEARIEFEDFYPFLDSHRIFGLMKNSSWAQKRIIMYKIAKFVDKIQDIGKKYGYDLNIEKLDNSKLQDEVVYIYHKDYSMLKTMGLL